MVGWYRKLIISTLIGLTILASSCANGKGSVSPESTQPNKTGKVERAVAVAVALTNPYGGGKSSQLYGLNAQTGTLIWADSLPQTALSVVAGLQGHEVAVVGTGDGNGISIYNGRTGALVKTWDVPGINAGFGESVSVGGDGTILFVSYGPSPTTNSIGRLAAYNIDTGAEIWSHQTRFPVWIATSSNESTVGAVSVTSMINVTVANNLFTLFDAKTGMREFAMSIPSQVVGMTNVPGSNMFAIAQSNDIRLLDVDDRRLKTIALRTEDDPIGIPGGFIGCSKSTICFGISDGVAALRVNGNHVPLVSDVINLHSSDTLSAMACSSDCDSVWFLGLQGKDPVLEKVVKYGEKPEILSRPLKGVAASLALVQPG